MSAKLLCRTGPSAGLTFSVRDVARIGRGGGTEVDLPLTGISRLHATVLFTGGTYWVEDAGSTNGTYVNGRRVTRERLRHLDVLSLGSGVDLLFILKASTSAEPSQVAGPSIESAQLVALDGPEAGAVREIPKGVLTVGRATACNLVLDSVAVSKMHARFERSGDILTVVDLGSSNGTFVNGVKVSAAPLQDGDRIVFGAVREFRVAVAYGGGAASGATPIPRKLAAPVSEETRIERSGAGTSWRIRYDFSPGENVPDERAKAPPGDRSRAAPTVLAKAVRTMPPQAAPAPPPEKRAVPAAPVPAPAVKVAVPAPAAAPQAKPAPAAPVPGQPATPLPPPPEKTVLTERARQINAVVLTGAAGTYQVKRGEHLVGRNQSCAIYVPVTKISRQQATLIVLANQVILKDLESVNGTFVNGERLSEPRELKEGDTVVFAESPFKVDIQYET